MKSSFVLLAFAAGVAVAQDSLPQCSQMCWNNMIGVAQSSFGCSAEDKNCQCANIDFGYGVRDCSQQACSPSDAQQAIAYGTNYCAGVASPEASSGALPVLSSALESVAASATGTGGAAENSAISTQPLLATITASDGNVLTQTTGFSTIFASVTGSAASAASSAAESAASAASSIAESLSESGASAASSASASVSEALSSGASRLSSALESATGSATGPESTGAAPMMTGLPVAGAAGLAALLLL